MTEFVRVVFKINYHFQVFPGNVRFREQILEDHIRSLPANFSEPPSKREFIGLILIHLRCKL